MRQCELLHSLSNLHGNFDLWFGPHPGFNVTHHKRHRWRLHLWRALLRQVPPWCDWYRSILIRLHGSSICCRFLAHPFFPSAHPIVLELYRAHSHNTGIVTNSMKAIHYSSSFQRANAWNWANPIGMDFTGAEIQKQNNRFRSQLYPPSVNGVLQTSVWSQGFA